MWLYYSCAEFIGITVKFRMRERKSLSCVWRLLKWFYRPQNQCLLLNVTFFPQATNEVISRAPESTIAEMESAVAAAKAAFPAWAETSVLSRQQVMFNLQHLVKKHMVWNCHNNKTHLRFKIIAIKITNVWFQKISIPPPQLGFGSEPSPLVTGNSSLGAYTFL